MSAPDNYSKIVLRPFHATPTTIVLREMPSPHHSWNRWPAPADVRTGVVYGEGQNYQTGYDTGTLSPGGGGVTVVYTFVG
jgi:hypothetical protein